MIAGPGDVCESIPCKLANHQSLSATAERQAQHCRSARGPSLAIAQAVSLLRQTAFVHDNNNDTVSEDVRLQKVPMHGM